MQKFNEGVLAAGQGPCAGSGAQAPSFMGSWAMAASATRLEASESPRVARTRSLALITQSSGGWVGGGRDPPALVTVHSEVASGKGDSSGDLVRKGVVLSWTK